MTLPITPVPEFPDVPVTPGVPPVLRQIGAAQNAAVLLVSDGLRVASLFEGPQWGLFTSSNSPAFSGLTASALINNVAAGLGVAGQSVGDFEFRQDYRISTAPQEQGAFLSYNKVQEPFDGRVTYIVSGDPFVRTAFQSQLVSLIASLDLLNLVMPEYQFIGCNITHYGFRRAAARGVTMILYDIWVQQVRVTGTAAFSDTKSPSGSSPVFGGNIQELQVEPNGLPKGAIT